MRDHVWGLPNLLGGMQCHNCGGWESVVGSRECPSGPIPCLDHGFVRLVDVMGDDARVVEAARLTSKLAKKTSDDRALIRYLMRHRHTSPFEFVVFTFHCKMPIFVARQWIRHRTGAFNEMSARYSELPEEFYVPRPEDIKIQAEKNRQGRGDGVMTEAKLYEGEFREQSEQAFARYRGLLEDGMARELARINLPLSTYTEWYWKVDLHNLLHFLQLRLDEHAQYEIRVYAEALAKIVEVACPLTWEAFRDFRLESVTLTRQEIEELRRVLRNRETEMDLNQVGDFPTKRERDEWVEKARRLGVRWVDRSEKEVY